MQLVEVRDLEGPNLFGLEPLIKLEVVLERGDSSNLLDELAGTIRELHQQVGIDVPAVGRRALDQDGHVALFFPWHFETCAVGIASTAFHLVMGQEIEQPIERLKLALERDTQEGNHPPWVRNSERKLPTVSITATNGKTTTTRLLVHIARTAGKRVGWTSSTGVYIEGECVLDGDFTGPAGARRVFREPDLDLGIFETARGGMLLRGMAYESNDVGIFVNVSPDHLSLQGVETLETLAEVKSLVVRITREDGWAVLSADYPQVWRWRDAAKARLLMISLDPTSPSSQAHLASGGSGVVLEDGTIVLRQGATRTPIIDVQHVPLTYEGRALFMVENALAAAAGAYGLGIDLECIRAGLRTFAPDTRHNFGRLNVFELQGRTIILDYAHNPDGVVKLAQFARTFVGDGCELHIIVGTAGDRREEDFREMGRLAAMHADAVYAKNTPGYERGTAPEDMFRWIMAGVLDAGHPVRFVGSFDTELNATRAAIEHTDAGDVIAIMSQAEQAEITSEIATLGGRERQ